MKKVLVIVGPTAVGKSDFGIEIAQKMQGEILSGDSIQVYRGFDIGSGKVTLEETQGIPHYLIDILDGKENYSVADFQHHARKAIDEIEKKDKLPIIVGGTGLYIKACMYDYHFIQETQKAVDKDLEEMSNEALYALLEKLDPKACDTIHPNNRKRVIRAIMIARSGKTKSEIEEKQMHQPIYDVLFLGITCSKELLHQRISMRVDKMVEKGLEKEIQTLLNQGIEFTDQSMQGIGYREWQGYFDGTCTKEEVVEQIKTHSRQFAKRQYTWFNHQIPVQWVNIEENNWKENAYQIIQQWRNHHE